MHTAAKFIVHELGGIFPKTYESIRALKGVGEYTAAAVASFAFDLPHAVVDGNVYRVLARYFGIGEPTDTTKGKKLFAELAQELLDKNQPGKYNQAIMDFGGTWCTPAAPKCLDCPFKTHCTAFQKGTVEKLPVKSKRLERRQRFFNYLLIYQGKHLFLKKRTGKDIWQNLYDFPLIETEALAENRDGILKNKIWQEWLGKTNWKVLRVSPPRKQELTHRQVIAVFWEIGVENNFEPPENIWIKVERSRLSDFAFPKIISLYLQEKLLPLELF
jgi:A/G-specific adenine glycosylase